MLDRKTYMKEWYLKHPDYMKQYYLKRRVEYPDYDREQYQKHKKRYNEYERNKRKTDLKFNLTHRMANAIHKALKGNKNGRRWESFVGYTCKDLIKHLKNTMPEGYTWNDYLEGKLHIDHIIPKVVFKYSKVEDINFKKCWALENLQLLPAEKNMKKSNKLYKPFQPALAI